MSQRSTSLLSCVAFLAVLGGCSSNPVTRVADRLESTLQFVCEQCPAAVGETTTTACLARTESFTITATEEQCFINVYNAHTAELDPIYACYDRVGQSFDSCMRTAISTCPPSPSDLTICTNMLGMSDCPSPSAATQAELTACNPT